MAVGLRIPESGGRPLRVLALGAHADDIEIGCGGTILTLLEAHPVDITWVVLGAADERRASEAEASAAAFLAASESATVLLGEFRDAFMPSAGPALKEFVDGLRGTAWPDIVLTHQRNDLHQDHRLISELTWNSFRDHLVLEYEVPKWDGDMGAPNVFVPLSADIARRKVELLMEHFGSQRPKDWFSADVFGSLMRLRAMECRAPEAAAEAFYGRKLTLDLS